VYHLNEREAFMAMSLFVKQFADRAGDDLLTLIGDIAMGSEGETFDPAAWDDWMDCVRMIAPGSGDWREKIRTVDDAWKGLS
jgi:hypothetical protein